MRIPLLEKCMTHYGLKKTNHFFWPKPHREGPTRSIPHGRSRRNLIIYIIYIIHGVWRDGGLYIRYIPPRHLLFHSYQNNKTVGSHHSSAIGFWRQWVAIELAPYPTTSSTSQTIKSFREPSWRKLIDIIITCTIFSLMDTENTKPFDSCDSMDRPLLNNDWRWPKCPCCSSLHIF